MPSNSFDQLMPSGLALPPGQVKEELDRILDSPDFKSTTRRRKLLRYLVEESLAGRDKGFKGYTIATIVFGRDESFDPQSDPVVRLEARRLRHDLNSYYVSAGRNSPLRITIPKGQYAPVMEWFDSPSLPDGSIAHLEAVNRPGPDTAPAPVPGNVLGKGRFAGRSLLFLMVTLLVAAVTITAAVLDRNAATQIHGPALAVLPFKTSDVSQPVLGEGFSDEVLARLSRFPDIRLYLPQSALEPTVDPVEVGRRLGLTYVVDGLVQSVAGSDSVRVTVRLTEVSTRRLVWIGKYERPYASGAFLAMQDDIATSIAAALGKTQGDMRSR
ncbi:MULTISPECIES: hypothetical protein [unclassified Rhizobium]|uniref:hypothetical protein n=1 Tax=unclassified Rhizobium TaxID=2613769 RepID=UPI001ADD46CF|nr:MULTISPECIES: hypothetical protein [unclassified Rhizobium]MBO9123970.1 hypothetical protein [Rhizobium sp. 16-488-2b]MBO9174502.1 hypothetical protein [Rhizobium sp. 16-488-2a]